MECVRNTSRVETVIVGGGQAGLSVGYHLKRLRRSFVILEGGARIGDVWRQRWDSLRLFTPARYNGLDGMPFPAPAWTFPTKDEMGDYLEAYAARFELPVHTRARATSVVRRGDGFIVTAGEQRIEADNVVVAMSNFQAPHVPPFAAEFDPAIVQLHSSAYRAPSQLREGGVLVVGAGNSGAEIGIETVRTHATWVSGRHPGHVPFRIGSPVARAILPVLFRLVFHRLLAVDTPLGRKVRPKLTTQGGPLIRVRPRDMAAAGIARVPRTVGARDGLPLLEDGRVLDVANVIWCTGFQPGFSWIHVPGCGPGEPAHRSGIMPEEPGLYFVGLHFLHAMSSVMIHGVGRDAQRIARHIARRELRLDRTAAEPLRDPAIARSA
jgi:putative flavoprotein involved in K+ transport